MKKYKTIKVWKDHNRKIYANLYGRKKIRIPRKTGDLPRDSGKV